MSGGLIAVNAMPFQAASCFSGYNLNMPVAPHGAARQSARRANFRVTHESQHLNPSLATSYAYLQTTSNSSQSRAPHSSGDHWMHSPDSTTSHLGSPTPAAGRYYGIPGRPVLQTNLALRLGRLRSDNLDGLLDVLHDIFRQVDSNQLEEAGNHLVLVGDWMARNLRTLGFSIVNPTDKSFTQERKAFLTMYNKAWLVALQRQHDYLSCNQAGPPTCSWMSRDQLKQMGRDFINTNDVLQPYGLIDYEGGILEEEILAQIEECISLWEDLWQQAEQVVAAGRNG